MIDPRRLWVASAKRITFNKKGNYEDWEENLTSAKAVIDGLIEDGLVITEANLNEPLNRIKLLERKLASIRSIANQGLDHD